MEARELPEGTGATGALGRLEGTSAQRVLGSAACLGGCSARHWGRGARTDGLGAGAHVQVLLGLWGSRPPFPRTPGCGSREKRLVVLPAHWALSPPCIWACKAGSPTSHLGPLPPLQSLSGVYRAGLGEQTRAPCGPDSDRLWPQISVWCPGWRPPPCSGSQAPPWGWRPHGGQRQAYSPG